MVQKFRAVSLGIIISQQLEHCAKECEETRKGIERTRREQQRRYSENLFEDEDEDIDDSDSSMFEHAAVIAARDGVIGPNSLMTHSEPRQKEDYEDKESTSSFVASSSSSSLSNDDKKNSTRDELPTDRDDTDVKNSHNDNLLQCHSAPQRKDSDIEEDFTKSNSNHDVNISNNETGSGGGEEIQQQQQFPDLHDLVVSSEPNALSDDDDDDLLPVSLVPPTLDDIPYDSPKAKNDTEEEDEEEEASAADLGLLDRPQKEYEDDDDDDDLL